MLQKQDNKCPCGTVFETKKSKVPCVDHNHKCCANAKSCGKCVRGLLCGRCNFVLGLLNEDFNLLPTYLINYLKEYPL